MLPICHALWELALRPAFGQTTFEVGLDPSYPSIASAMQAASDGDTIRIHAGEGSYDGAYYESLPITDRSVTFEGVGDPTLIPGDPNAGAFDLFGSAEIVVRGVTIDGLGSCRGGRVRNGATLTLEDSTVVDTSSQEGGSFWVVDAHLEVRDSLFERGSAQTTGGFVSVVDGGSLTVRSSTFREGQAATGDGGAIYCGAGPCTIEDTLFVRNAAGSDGGAVAGEAGVVTVKDSRFCDNLALERAGALELHGPAEVLRSVFVGNVAETGPGGAVLFAEPALLRLSHNDFAANAAAEGGAAVHIGEGSIAADHNLFLDHPASLPILSLAQDPGDALAYTLFWNNAGEPSTHGEGRDAVHADPLLENLDYGDCEGSDMHLAAGSPAIDAGDPASPDLDGSPADIGAFGPIDPNPTDTAGTGGDASGPAGASPGGDRDGDGVHDSVDPAPDDAGGGGRSGVVAHSPACGHTQGPLAPPAWLLWSFTAAMVAHRRRSR